LLKRARMTLYQVDPDDRRITDDDLACWLLFFLESHGADVVLTDTGVLVDLNPMPGMDAVTAERWGPIIAILLPTFREILLARRSAAPLASGV
jgi:hypothetical protein